MPSRAISCAALVAALLLSGTLRTRAATHRHHRIGLILHDNVAVRAKADSKAPVMAVLVQQTQVVVLAQRKNWTHVAIWASLKGWVPRKEVVFRRPWSTVSTYRAPEVHYHVQAHSRQAIHAVALTTAPVTSRATPGGKPSASLATRSHLTITSWQQDATGGLWYQSGKSWLPGDGVQFQWKTPSNVGKRPAWKLTAGKGMWITLGPAATSAPSAVVDTAVHNGVTHLYVESAISPLGFHGKGSVGPLIEAAHRRHVAVVAWVYPYLYDIASDVALTGEVAAFRTPSGDRFDGIAADLERNVHLSTVRGYSQLIRAILGPRYALVGVTYPPQSVPDFPFAEVAHDYDVLAPMDYWHQTKTATGLDYGHLPYGREYGYRYALDSIRRVRAAGAHIPIAPIGQVFDDFGRLEMGPYAPSADEIKGFLAGSKAGGAIGASFFQWMTATVDEWRAIRDFRY
jgi:hypothetical protein